MNTWSSFINKNSINEDRMNINDMISEIINILQSPVMLDERAIRRVYTILKPIGSAKSIEKLLAERGIGDMAEDIFNVIDHSGDIDLLIDLLNHPEKLPTVQDFFNGSNIYELLKPTKISQLDLVSIANNDKAHNGITRGKYEALMCLLLNGITKGNSALPGHHVNDVNTVMGGIEIKGNKARIMGQQAWRNNNPEPTFEMLVKEKIGKDIKLDIKSGLFGDSNTLLDNIHRLKSEGINLTDDEWIDIIAKSAASMFVDSPTDINKLPELNEIINFFHTHSREWFGDFFRNTKNKSFGKSIYDIFATLDLYFYKKEDGWDWIAFFNNNGDYIVVNAKNMSNIENTYKNVIIANNGILFNTAKPRGGRNAREGAVQVHISK